MPITQKDIDDACEAELIYGADLLEYYAANIKAKRSKRMSTQETIVKEIEKEVGMFDFASALHLLMGGSKLARRSWHGANLGVRLQVPDENSKMTMPYFYLEYPTNARVPWVPSVTDILAYDWCVVN